MALAAAAMAGNVLHLERLRAGRLQEHDGRIRLHQLGDVGADQRIVERRLDAEALEDAVAHFARRLIDRVGHQDVVAGLREGQQGGGDGGGTRRRQPGACAAFQRADGLLEGIGRGRAAPAVDIALLALLERLERFEEHGRAAIDGRIDEAVVREGIAARVDDVRSRCGASFSVRRPAVPCTVSFAAQSAVVAQSRANVKFERGECCSRRR